MLGWRQVGRQTYAVEEEGEEGSRGLSVNQQKPQNTHLAVSWQDGGERKEDTKRLLSYSYIATTVSLVEWAN